MAEYKFDIAKRVECDNCGKLIGYMVPSLEGGAVLRNIQEILCPSCYLGQDKVDH